MLRVFLPAPPRADRADRWVRCNAEGRVIARGQDLPSHWPADPAIDVVLAAGQVRLIALALPPMPRERLRGAVRYALDDQIATAPDESSIAIAEPRDGRCLVAVASERLVRALSAHDRRIARIVPESALAPTADGWIWCASSAGDGFVRRADGSAFAVQAIDKDGGSLPHELTAAIAQATRAHAAPANVHVAFPADAPQLAHWSRACAVPFVAAPTWQWEQASSATFAAAPDFLRDATRGEAQAKRSSTMRTFRPALILAGLALAIHLAGLVAEWSWLNVENWRLSRALVHEAAAAQLPDASDASAAFHAIARQNALLRHRAWQSAPADALPLLARAAPALGTLPFRALRSARYSGNAWTLELGSVDPLHVSQTTRRLADAGIDAVTAPTTGGMRMRLSLGSTAR
jgi:type II secretion system protein L